MRTLLRDVFGCLLAVVVLAGACNSAKKIESGEACTLNSDCKSPLVCTMGKCHQGCRETRDCPAGQSCLVVEAVGVCQLPDETSCATKPCATGLVCAVDQRCHTGCLSPTNCSKGQVCTDSVCADTSQLVDGTLPDSAPMGPDAGADVGWPDAPLPDAALPDAPLPDAPLSAAPLPDAALPDAPLPPADTAPDVDTAPRITSFVAAAYAVKPGHPTMLTAVFTNGTGIVTPGNLAIESNTPVSTGDLDASTTFTLTVTGSGGEKVTASLTITVLTSPPSIVEMPNPIGMIVTDGTNLYFRSARLDALPGESSLMKAAVTGGEPTMLTTGVYGSPTLATDGTDVYWTEPMSGQIMKLSASGTTPISLASGQLGASAIAVDGENVYWTINAEPYVDSNGLNTGLVMKTRKSGGSPAVTLATRQPRPGNIAVYGDHVYWVGNSLDLGVTLTTVAVSGNEKARDLVVDLTLVNSNLVVNSNGIYWMGTSTNAANSGLGLYRLALAGGTPKLIVRTETAQDENLAIDGKNAYWSYVMTIGSAVKKAAIDGSGVVTPLAFLSGQGLAIDANSVYVSEGSKIYKLAK